MGRLATALPALIYAGAMLAVAIVHKLRDASQLIDDIFDQERTEES